MLASTILPLALVGAAASVVPSVSASPIQVSGQAPSVSGPDGSLSRELLQRDFKQAVERSLAHLSAAKPTEKDEECKLSPRTRKVKRSSSSVPLYNSGDTAYLAAVQVGTPAQQIPMMIDTGSGDMVVPKATANFPASQGAFDSKKSRTFNKGDGSRTSFTYGVGSAEGEVVKDKVRLGRYIMIKQSFGLVDDIDTPWGIFGLSFSSISKIKAPTFLDRLVRDKELDQNLFGLYHSRGSVSGSQLTLGAVDSSRYTGELTTIPTVSQTHWTVQLDHATIDGEVVYDGPVFSAVDSGTSVTYLPRAVTEAYFARIPGSYANPENTQTTEVNGETVVGQIYDYPCDAKLPTLGLVFAGSDRQFDIAAQDMFIPQPADKQDGKCYSSIIGADVTYYGQKAALIGVPFLKSYYSVFNVDDATVSLATAKH